MWHNRDVLEHTAHTALGADEKNEIKSMGTHKRTTPSALIYDR